MDLHNRIKKYYNMLISSLLYALIIDQILSSDLGITNSPEEKQLKGNFSTSENVTMTRITQPSEILPAQRNFDLSASLNKSTKEIKMKDFIPSPALETYEYNKVPVKPAVPEAKAFNGGSFNTYESSIPRPWDQTNWKDRPGVNDWRGGQETGNNKVKFPTHQENPYTITTGLGSYKGNNYYPNPSDESSIKRPTSYSPRNPSDEYSLSKPAGFPTKSISDSYGAPIQTNLKPPQHKTFMDYNLMEKPPYYEDEILYPTSYGSSYEINRPHKTHGYGVYNTQHESGHNGLTTGDYKSPWKKIIKFLAAIIPIGLLISAFTPNVINIHNNTEPA